MLLVDAIHEAINEILVEGSLLACWPMLYAWPTVPMLVWLEASELRPTSCLLPWDAHFFLIVFCQFSQCETSWLRSECSFNSIHDAQPSRFWPLVGQSWEQVHDDLMWVFVLQL